MNWNVGILPGDGIGPEIMEQAKKILLAVEKMGNHAFHCEEGYIGGVAIDRTGNPFPDETYELCKRSDAVLFGAIGEPKYDHDPKAKIRPEQGLLAMRKKLGLFANIRPVRSFRSLAQKSPLRSDLIDNIDFVVIRELTGGIYFGEPRGRSEDGKTAFDTCLYTRDEVHRILELAFTYARNRKNKVTVVDKANVLATSRLWRETAQKLHAENSDIQMEYMFVDNAAMQLIQYPKQFDVIVTENMFGDILTDEASVITGSLGLLPSASVGLLTSVFEPIHGSYPQAAGKNIANPLGMILSTALMLDVAFNLHAESDRIVEAVEKSLEEGVVTEDIADQKPYSTSEVGDWVAGYIQPK